MIYNLKPLDAMSSPSFFLLLKCYFCVMIWKLCRSFHAKIQKAINWGGKHKCRLTFFWCYAQNGTVL